MADKAKIAAAIRRSPKEAEDALLEAQAGSSSPLTFEVLKVAAEITSQPIEDVAVDTVERRGLLRKFEIALNKRGIAFEADDEDLFGSTQFNPEKLRKFIGHANAFCCRVHVNGSFAGSGCLISPSQVLTAWHVIAAAAPDAPDSLPHPIEVQLSDGARRHARPRYESRCTNCEFQGRDPSDEAMFVGFNDIALIKLDRPDGMHLGFAPLPLDGKLPQSGSTIALWHFPQGRPGFLTGKISKYKGITARWKHDIATDHGSSGGPCFDTSLAFAGLHQGKWPPNGRLVPAARFIADIRPLVESDIAPTTLWSLDGTIDGPLVIGRDLFFEAVAGATRPKSRVRGIRVKRLDVKQGTTGLAFSMQMLTRILERNPGMHRTVRVSFESQFDDLIDEIRRRAIEGVGRPIPPVEADAGTRTGETSSEATLQIRAGKLAEQLNAISERDGELLWFLFENPPAGLIDIERLGLEAFVGAALRQQQLRLVLTGFETISLPGEEFRNASVFDTEGKPGLVVEYFGFFDRGDVERLLKRACQDFGRSVDPAVISDRASEILNGLPATNGKYSVADLKTVAQKAARQLEYFQSSAESQP